MADILDSLEKVVSQGLRLLFNVLIFAYIRKNIYFSEGILLYKVNDHLRLVLTFFWRCKCDEYLKLAEPVVILLSK